MIKNLKNLTDLSGLYFVYNGSTNFERKGIYGIAHLMEHLKCKAFEDLQDELQANGIAWNAYTGDNQIVFYFTGLEEYLAPFRDTIIERMYSPFENYVDAEILEKEKSIVLEEYQDSFTNQNEIFYLNLFRKKFNHYSPIGLKEDIENLTLQDCLDFHKVQYEIPDLIINISKDYTLEKTLEFTDRKDSLKSEWNENPEAPIEIRGEYPDSLCLLYYRQIEEQDIPVVKLISSMLSSGLNSPLYQEVREKRALCYYVGSYIHEMGKLPLLSVMILTSPEKSETVHNTINDVFTNKDIHLTENRLDTIRKALLIAKKKKLINRHDNIGDILDANADKLNSIIETITLEEILKVYDKYFILNTFTKVDDKNF
jgi:predicted Zn-dependent peptidase